MSDMAIKCEGLWKEYRLGRRERYLSLRDRLAAAAQFPFRKLKSAFRRSPAAESPGSGTFWAVKNISFDVRHGEVVGVIGHNGAGKSTLLKILSQITKPTSGRVMISGRVGSLLEVGTGFHPELTGRENVYLNGAILGMRKAEIKQKFDAIVAFAEVEKFLDTPVKHYSSGMYVRLAFAVAAYLEPEILLIDEVLAVGDTAFQQKCLGKMADIARQERTVFFVSHNMAAIRNLCSRAMLLKGGRLELQGDVNEVVQHYLTEIDSGAKEASLAERSYASTNGRLRILSLRALPSDRKTSAPRAGARAEFLIDYACEEGQSLSKLYVGIGVKDVLGTGVFLCSTAMTKSEFRAIPSGGRITCSLETMPLIPGKYFVDLKLIDEEGRPYVIDKAASFDVLDGGESGFSGHANLNWGSVLVPHDWSLVAAGGELGQKFGGGSRL